MISSFRVQNYKALRDVTLKLTPVHVLIGPNDSGKTSILNALAALSGSTDHALSEAFIGSWDGHELVWHGDPEGIIRIAADLSVEGNDLQYTLACRFASTGRNVVVQQENISQEGEELDCANRDHRNTRVHDVCIHNQTHSEEVQRASRLVHQALSPFHYYCWNPRHLALPVAPDVARSFRMHSSGFGLAQCLDDILGYDRGQFAKLEEKFCSIFPEIGSIKLRPESAFRSSSSNLEQVPQFKQGDGKGLYFEIRRSKQLVRAAQTSDGVLLILAYLAVLFSPQPPRLILVEEPENGVHPKRLQEVLAILRKLVDPQSQSQVVLTTHSPYAVDLFTPEEVTLCTKTAEGAVVLTPMAESNIVKQQRSVFTLGEIWTAEGDETLAKDHSHSPIDP